MAVRLPKLCRNPISAHTYPYQEVEGALEDALDLGVAFLLGS